VVEHLSSKVQGLEFKPSVTKALHLVGKWSTTELHPQPSHLFVKKRKHSLIWVSKGYTYQLNMADTFTLLL
jgi:hypothetical protein